jgi:hypothetical protein
MPSFERQAPQVGFTPSPQGGVTVDTSAAQVISGVGQIATSLIQHSQAEEQRSFEKAKGEYINAFEDALIGASEGEQRGFQQQAAAETGDPDLTVDDKKILDQARGASSGIDRLEAAGKDASVVNLRRIAEYQKFKAMAPHLAPELREFFKKQTGKAVLETLSEIETSKASEAQKAADQEKEFWTKFTQQNYLYKPGMSLAEMITVSQPLMQEMREAEASKRTLERLNRDESISDTQKRVAQKAAFDQGASGLLIAVNQSVQTLLAESDFDPSVATMEQRAGLRDMLLNRKRLNELEVRDAGSRLDATYLDKRLAVINSAYDQAVKYVNGELTLEQFQTSTNLLNAAASHRLLSTPGVADGMALLNQFKGIDSGLFTYETKLKVGREAERIMMKAFTQGSVDPSKNPYEEVRTSLEPEEQVIAYKEVMEKLRINLDNPEARESVRNTLESLTNFAIDPSQVPTGVLDAVFDAAADPNWLKVQEGGLNLNDNLYSAIREFGQRMQSKMGDDLSSDLSGYVNVKTSHSPEFIAFGNNYLGQDFEAKRAGNPRAGDVVDMRVNKDGSLSFTPVSQFSGDVRIRNLARDLTRKYSQPFSKMVRAYAHTVNADTNYEKAFQEFMSNPGLKEVSTFEQADVQPATEQEGGMSAEEMLAKVKETLTNLPALGQTSMPGNTQERIYGTPRAIQDLQKLLGLEVTPAEASEPR